jgi:hypothetical protein
MFRVSEPTTNVKLDRINADLKVVKEIGAHIDVNIKDDDIVRVIRLGKKVDNNTSEFMNFLYNFLFVVYFYSNKI